MKKFLISEANLHSKNGVTNVVDIDIALLTADKNNTPI